MKREVRRLLTKGLTGKEAGRLILEDSWEVDRGREGFLSDADIQRIKQSLNTPQDIQDYNTYVATYRLVDYSIKDAHILALQAKLLLKDVTDYLGRFWLDTMLRNSRIFDAPCIMTEKQYQELQARQRDTKLKMLHTLDGILMDRAYYLASEEEKEQCDGDTHTVAAEHPELVEQAALSLLALLRTDKLELILLRPEDRERMAEIEGRIQAIREKKYPPDEPIEVSLDKAFHTQMSPPDWRPEDEEDFSALIDERNRLRVQVYFDAKEHPLDGSKEQIARLLEKASEGSLDEDEEELLSEVYALEAERYDAGLPEAIEWVDEYTLGYDEPNQPLAGIAILQSPKSSQLDERGYYQREDAFLDDLMFVHSMDERLKELGHPRGILELVEKMLDDARAKIRDFLAFQAVIATTSEALGVDFTEDIQAWYESIEQEVEWYNEKAKGRPGRGRFLFLPEGLKVPTIRLSMYKPKAETLQYLRERMAMSLGEDWYREVVKALDSQGIFEPGLQEGEEAADGQA